MNLLFFTEISPFPINGGERIRSYGLLKALSDLNYQVTAIIQNIDKINLQDYALPNIKYVEYKEVQVSRLGYLFNSAFYHCDRKVLEIFDLEISRNSIDLVILDFYQAGKYYNYFKKRNIPFVIGTHNAESNLILQRPLKSPMSFFRMIQETFYMYIHERFFYKYANSIITVSDKDSTFYSKFIESKKIHMIPNFLDESRYRNDESRSDYIAMTANFGPFMNQEGLKWLINEVWNLDLDSRYELKLIGKNSKQALKGIEGSTQYKNIKALGEVDNIQPYIAKAKMVLVPLLHGSGTRLKCLEAMALKTPIISTSKGCEGIKTNNIIVANSKEDFRNAIFSFSDDKGVGEKLHMDFMKEYSLEKNIERVKKMVESSILK